MLKRSVVALLLSVAVGCGGDELSSGSRDCPYGGVRITVDSEKEVVCNGAPGQQGERGAMGEDGAATGGGAGWAPETIMGCGAVTTLPVSRVSVRLEYHLVTFTDGSRLVSCTAESTHLVSGDRTVLYAGWQQGSIAGTCMVVSDASGSADSGWWSFELVGGLPRATYNDEPTADHLATYTFRTSDCPTANRP
jgi:hypothetical protein